MINAAILMIFSISVLRCGIIPPKGAATLSSSLFL
nr:MAG TPA: hypothetical protein [Caudoviricetes sp.]